ncbi:MAG: antitoxin family protein, partial [Gemmataceae bacterium]
AIPGRGMIMAIIVDAVIENGLLRPTQPLPFAENETVRIIVQPKGDWVQDSYGLCGWKGDAEDLRRLALSPELDLEEEP